jgi:hypothetical protein
MKRIRIGLNGLPECSLMISAIADVVELIEEYHFLLKATIDSILQDIICMLLSPRIKVAVNPVQTFVAKTVEYFGAIDYSFLLLIDE